MSILKIENLPDTLAKSKVVLDKIHELFDFIVDIVLAKKITIADVFSIIGKVREIISLFKKS